MFYIKKKKWFWTILLVLYLQFWDSLWKPIVSSVARAFSGGQAAHPKDQIGEENEEK